MKVAETSEYTIRYFSRMSSTSILRLKNETLVACPRASESPDLEFLGNLRRETRSPLGASKAITTFPQLEQPSRPQILSNGSICKLQAICLHLIYFAHLSAPVRERSRF